ncbi:MAG: putative cilia- and flagella-associated protein 57 [Streblomastix strix]|uniref:Putative cilia-and flagella-associated protein 57 n=1 Tax=Streblomastix strix TaxID=222440 RepID=A0A5J4VIN6_9EUKA|nr:MAG: putative cilia- and flagella-associated protein 57 [Streblomastix strix]
MIHEDSPLPIQNQNISEGFQQLELLIPLKNPSERPSLDDILKHRIIQPFHNKDDNDSQLETCREFYQKKITAVTTEISDLAAETANSKKACDVIDRDASEFEKKRVQQMERIHEKQKEIQTKMNEREQMRAQIAKQDGVIREREDVVHELKRTNQDLEKHKYVKDYRIKELKMNMKPREERIKTMREDIGALDTNLDSSNKQTQAQETQLQQLKQEIADLHQQIKKVTEQAVFAETRARSTEEAIQQAEPFVQDPPKLRAAMFALARNTGAASKIGGLDKNISAEYERQNAHLSATQTQLQKELSEETTAHQLNKLKLMQENTKLIEECRNLRRKLRNKAKELRAVRDDADAPAIILKQRQAPSGVPPRIAKQLQQQAEEIDRLRRRLDDLRQPPSLGAFEQGTRTNSKINFNTGGATAAEILPDVGGSDDESTDQK